MQCGAPTLTDPDAPPKAAAPDAAELARVRAALGDRYRVGRIIGEGGMATVYVAEDLKHRRNVAVKVMRRELAATVEAERFLREVEIAAQLNHPHILPMYDSGESGGVLYYVMPFVEEESLQGRMSREGQMQAEEACRLAREVAEALAYAHERGIVHRDIKPANILLSAGHALVADFGIARAVRAGGEALTQTSSAVGTPQYMSPEQASGASDVDGRADVYAVGSVLYEMLAGEPPFTGPTAQVILARSLTEVPRPLAATRPELPAQISAVISKALARSPSDRYQTAGALAQALGVTLETSASGVRAAVAVEEPAPALLWMLFAVASLAALSVVFVLMRRWGLPAWAVGLAVLFLAIGAGVLVVIGRVERRRRNGWQATGLWRLFTRTNAAVGGAMALGLWAAVATMVAVQAPKGIGEGIRLAVLPFELRGDTADTYLAAGIADEIRGKLAVLPGFRIIARTSSDQYRGTTKPIQQIGRELEADYLLSATVRTAADPTGGRRVQVVPELIGTRSGDVTWQQTFDASLTDVFDVQSEIAGRVAEALGVALGGEERRKLAERPTSNLAAWDLYLKGRALTANDPATLKQAAGYFDQAAALDTTFTDAWARLAASLSNLYYNGTPDPEVARRARDAAERALAIDPDGSAPHAAMARYFMAVEKDPIRAEDQMTLALKASPNDPRVLTSASSLEETLGRWDEALSHLQRARRLDPRSVRTAGSLRTLLLLLRRYPEALDVGKDALALSPSDPNNIEGQAMIFLAQGDLAGARRVIDEAPGGLGQEALVAYLATYNDLFWVLDDAQQRVLLQLPPSAFFDDPTAWGSVFMQTYWYRGEKARARAYADTARMAFEAQLKSAPDDPQLHVLLGLALAYMGRKDDAIAEGERGVALAPLTRDASNGAYYQHQLVRIYLMVGEPEKALDLLEPLLKMPYFLSPGWLRIDPTFASLRRNPRFEKLTAGSD
jgi:TolB-like protein/tRNA A-37 threonylcarbamoyl transferase component Bud32/Tfp pilus assembly protein PilF